MFDGLFCGRPDKEVLQRDRDVPLSRDDPRSRDVPPEMILDPVMFLDPEMILDPRWTFLYVGPSPSSTLDRLCPGLPLRRRLGPPGCPDPSCSFPSC